MYPIPGEPLWEKSQYNRPPAPPVKRGPGCLKKKRRKDADEGTSGSKNPKDSTKLSRKYREFTCTYCGQKGHTKRSCIHRKNDDATCAEIAAAEAAKKQGSTSNPQAQTNAAAAEQEIDITQPDYSQPLIVEEEPTAPDAAPLARPDKLPLRRGATQPQQHPHMDPMQGASVGTTRRWADIIRTMPTPGFIPPRKK
ncbi:hypothetical protein PIB30_037549 [Stylosanthes scabra]|uniref:CCHC-type domain-containing protein n=1 Tax=Stylosanthes scabra TaxID=79078 RepID=A0ABU6SDW0_9FABA|nr:hypothetical protein [Stylosanthes scabra]